MGSQQLLLIVVGVVLIGIMVAVGMDMFKDQAASTNRDSISNDLVHYAVQAQKYYRRPTVLGGGAYSFNGLTLAHITKAMSNSNGVYVLTPDPGGSSDPYVTITGTGFNTGNDESNPVQMQVTVWSDSTYLETLN
jgi:Tfp pilus assembly protein PilE